MRAEEVLDDRREIALNAENVTTDDMKEKVFYVDHPKWRLDVLRSAEF